jgi:amino acid adenylation domain-containing protein
VADTIRRPTRAGTAASTSSGLAEMTVAVAAVLSRCSGTDRVTVSGDHPRWRYELVLPRASSPRDALARVAIRPTDRVTITTTDPSGRRHAAHIDFTGHTTWAWADPPAGRRGAAIEADPHAGADERVRRTLRQFLADPDTALSDLPILSPAERECHAALDRPPIAGAGVNVVVALRRHAADRPTQPAIVDGDGSVSYAELDDRVGRCAAAFAAYGLGPGQTVALMLPRSAGLIVAMLGALWAGATFTIINPSTPTVRARRLVQDAGAGLVVAEHVSGMPVTVAAPAALAADRYAGAAADDPAHTAYIMFTSGSTGQPKGVTISRSALWCYLAAVAPAYALSAADRVLQLAEPGFDVMLEEVLPTIAIGACVVVADARWLDSPDRFLAQLERQRTTVLNLPSSLWTTLLQRDGQDEFAALADSVRLVVVGSERVSAPAYLSWHRTMPSRIRLLNAYGMTETTITSLVYQPDHGAPDTVARIGSVPIGRPLAHTRVRIVDGFGDPCPFGLLGELVVGGASVFSGYCGTHKQGTELAVSTTSSADGYRTGDLVYLDRTGVVVHAGRVDTQLKVRGHRIEPAEVEAALESLPAVRRALCTTIADEHLTRLVAVVEAGGAVESSTILADLSRLLPRWLMPDQLVVTARLPVNAHGKVDQPAMRSLFADLARCPEPGELTGTERVVADCVSQLLGCATPAASDSFYALGGTSLQAIRLVLRLAERAGVVLSARDVLADPTIAAIARAVEATRANPAVGLVRRRERGSFPLTPSQRAMVRFLTQSSTWRPYFEMWEGFTIQGPLNSAALRRALLTIVAEHEPLRTVLDLSTMTQRVLPNWPPIIHQFDLASLPPTQRVDFLRREVERARRPFDLGTRPAFRPVLLRLGAEEHVLSLTFHHLFFDGWSYGLLYERLGELYAAFATGAAPPPRPPRPEFGDYSLRLAAEATGEVERRDLDYWRGVLGEHRAPAICAHLTTSDANSISATHTVDMDTSSELERLAAAWALTPFALLKAAFAMVLGGALHHHDLLIAANDANRFRAGTEHIVGYLATSLLSRFQLRGEDSFLDIAHQVHANLIAAREHLSVQWEDIVRELGLGNAVQFRFSLQTSPSTAAPHLPGLTVRAMPAMVAGRGKRAVAVVAWRRPHGYELQWYARDDAMVIAPARALALLHTVLASAVADPGLTVARVALLMSHPAGGAAVLRNGERPDV